MSAARTERLLNLLTLLLNRRHPVSLREIRELDEFHAYRGSDPKSGERAFERDKAALVELGVPLRWVSPEVVEEDDEGVGGYRIDRERYFLPDLHLSADEVAMLSIAGAAAAAIDGFGTRAAVIRALAKLGFDVDAAGAAPALAHAPLQAGVDAAQVGAHLAVLHPAVGQRRRVALRYLGIGAADAAPEPPPTRLVDPWGLYYRAGAWYLVGLCHTRGACRTFHLGRIEAVVAAGGAAAFAVPADFDLRAHARRRPWTFGPGPAQPVVVRLAPRLRPQVRTIFGADAALREAEGRLEVHLEVAHLPALVAAIMPYGADAEVVAPAAARASMGATYARLAERYRRAAP